MYGFFSDPGSMQIGRKRDGNDSDTDSEMSERVSLDLASSHSSDDDEDLNDVQLDWEKQPVKNKKIGMWWGFWQTIKSGFSVVISFVHFSFP